MQRNKNYVSISVYCAWHDEEMEKVKQKHTEVWGENHSKKLRKAGERARMKKKSRNVLNNKAVVSAMDALHCLLLIFLGKQTQTERERAWRETRSVHFNMR